MGDHSIMEEKILSKVEEKREEIINVL